MTTVELMIFDLDGTLVDSGTDLAASVNHALACLGLPGLPKERVISHVGDGVGKLIERSLGEKATSLKDRALDLFLSHYETHLLDATVPYPGVPEVLEHFASIPKVILTNKTHRFSVSIAEGLGLARYFEDIYGMDSHPWGKPDPRLLGFLLERHGARREKTAVIGDGVNDVLLAKNGGAVSCALLNGLGDGAKLLALDPDYALGDIRELPGVLSPP